MGDLPMSVDRVLLAEPRGFCAGVEMAIKALAWMVRSFEPPVYCYHEIVHNRLVVDRFERQGVVFVDDIADVPPGRPIMLSAHGSAPEVVAAARARGSYVVDSVCPLVTKVHHEVKVRAGKGYRIVYVGHEGHEEAVGTMAVAPGSISRVESVAEVDALPEYDEPVALLAQTTLSHRDWQDVAVRVGERFPDVWTPGRRQKGEEAGQEENQPEDPKQYNFTDPESRIMKGSDGFVQGYNCQIAVEENFS